ncbi:hypothetical protein R1A27_04800 [Methylobacterium sp. NMS12]|uniref:hypothetical protein n=1 Tax=Methylobacterium sp. NMS12 TaxID=3079766 RepID=UPI003F885410
MINGSPKINNNDVVCSGSVVLNEGDEVQIYPLPTDVEFSVKFKIILADEDMHTIEVYDDGPRRAVIEMKRRFTNNGSFGSRVPLVFAIEDDKKTEYAMSLKLEMLGTKENYTAVLHYTVVRRPLSVELV